ncbi:MAG TPA: glycosyltransferase [Pyrinomonadaceae bacterium]|nr:glycosyltransferase [Pyrinomonadaceae bacterium]
MTSTSQPLLSVIVPSFNNLAVLQRCLTSWMQYAPDAPIEILVIEDGCRDQTAEYLREVSESEWGKRYLRWFHENDVGELLCNNRGFAEARANLMLVWQDDMFLESDKLVPELIATFDAYTDIGLLSLSRGLNCVPIDEPIETWEDLIDWRRLPSTIGDGPLNWFKLQEVDIVVRPWVVRREVIQKVGVLDKAFCPHEWDEADFCYRLRDAGWKVATHGYERAGFFSHLGSMTIGKKPPAQQQQLALKNGLIFHERWGTQIQSEHPKDRQTWWRRVGIAGLSAAVAQIPRFLIKSGTSTAKNEQNS